jgi:15-cis-phytoene synthase
MQHDDAGSSIYYSLLYCNELQHNSIRLFRHLFQTLKDIVLESREPQIAQTKLEWWQVELQSSTPQHHLTKALLPYHTLIDQKALQHIISILIKDLHTPLYETQEKLLVYYSGTAGKFEQLFASIYNVNDQDIIKKLNDFGMFIQMVINLRDIRLLMQHGRTYVSGETLLAHHVTLKQLSAYQLTDNIRQLFYNLCHIAKSYFQSAQENLADPQRKKILPTLILANIHKKLLDEIEKADFPVLQQRIGLTPLRKWWISFMSLYVKALNNCG